MSLSIGIIGLPNSGKSTFFVALTKKQALIAPYAFSTRQPNVGMVAVPDERLEKISQIAKQQKITPAFIEFVDIAGLVRGAHQGQGLGNQFLSHIKPCDGLVEVVRGFANPEIEHSEGELNSKRDIEIIKTELLMKDMEILEKTIEKLKKEARANKKIAKKLELLEILKEKTNQGHLISEAVLNNEEKTAIKEFQLLTAKPILYLLNINEQSQDLKLDAGLCFVINLKLEQEFSELEPQQAKELGFTSGLDKLISDCYNILGLITFFTITGAKETRAWTLKKGFTALEAAGLVHSDFAQKFIKAEVIGWQKLIEAKSWAKVREQGLLKVVGRDYVVADGDVIEFKI